MDTLSWWEFLLAVGLGSSAPEVLMAAEDGVSWHRTHFRSQAQKRLRQWAWNEQNQQAHRQWQAQTQNLPAPKHQLLHVTLQASERIGENLTNHVNLDIRLTPLVGHKEAFVVANAIQLDLFGQRIHSVSESLWHRSLGSVHGWSDSALDSEWWRTTKPFDWVAPLANGALPKTFSMTAQTSNVSLKNPLATRYATHLQCQSSTPYTGRRIHPNIQGQVQLVDCVRTVNGKPMFTLQSLYLLDYQYSIPTTDHLFDRRWQWQVVAFESRPNQS